MKSPKAPTLRCFASGIAEFWTGTVGQLISRYRLLEKAGGRRAWGLSIWPKTRGSAGRGALKFISEALLKDKNSRNRLVREAKAAAAIDHPNVASVYEIDEVEGQPFIAMAYVKGQSLEDRIAEGPLEIRDALNIACQLADGLEAAHRQGITHRDLKPANVILEEGAAGSGSSILAWPNSLTPAG